SPGNAEIFESPTFDLSNLDTALVTMRVAYARKVANNIESLRVLISTDCGETWVFKKVFVSFSDLSSVPPTPDPFVPESQSDWKMLVLDNITPAERTSNFRIKFEFNSGGGNNIYLDDINIVEEVVINVDHNPTADY